MAITFVAATEAGTSAAATSQAINVPSGVQDNDLLLLFATSADGDTDPISTPSGWTEIVDNIQTGGAAPSPPGMSVYWRVASSEPASYTISVGATATGIALQMLAFRGVDTTTPIDVTSTTATGDSTNANPASINPVSTVAVAVAACWDSTTAVYSAVPSGYTSPSALGAVTGTGGGNGCTMASAYLLSPSDPEDPPAFTSSTEQWAAATVALREGAVVAYEQEGFRWRDDDGSESGATWRQSQDVADTVGQEENIRLRVLVDATGDAPSHAATLQYKRDDEAASEWRTI